MIKSKKNKQQLVIYKQIKRFLNTHLLIKSFLFVFLLFFGFFRIAFAQSLSIQGGDVKVTARIPDIIPPSTPILITPEDTTNVDTAFPVFQWYASSDNKGMSHYQFILDGRVWFDDIPLINFANDDYSLNYDVESGIYTLVAKIPLIHGKHNWQIIAFDYADNQAASTTWSFNVFVNAPNFIIKTIGDANVTIKANDPASVPSQPIGLFLTDPVANEPWIIAFGDANLKVDLIVSIPNRENQIYSQNTNGEGNWSLQLGILPRDLIIKLDFTISDAVGHSSYIKELYIIILQHYWPATPIPTATITGIPLTGFPTLMISPTPQLSKTPLISQTSIAPTLVPTTPGIKIPIIPPKEIVERVAEEVKESLPSKIATFITNLTRSPLWKAIAEFFALIVALFLPLITYILVLLKFNQFWSIKTMREVLIALWPWSRRRKNLVFEYRSSQAVPLVRIELLDAETKEIIDWQITNYLGQFFSFAWPSDQLLSIAVKDQNFYFPIGGNKPLYLSWDNFYQGEPFFLKKDFSNQQAKNFNPKRALAIPTLLAQGKHDLPLIERIRIILSYLLSYPWWLWTINLLIVLLITLRYPSFFNYLSLIYFFLVAIFKYFYSNGSKKWQFRAIYSNAYKIDHNLILIVNDLVDGFSQAQVVKISESLSSKIDLIKNDFVFSLQTKDYAFWDGNRVISEMEYSLNQEIISEFKLHLIDNSNHSFKILQAHCQLLPRQ